MEAASKEVFKTQKEFLLLQLLENEHSEYGRRYKFSEFKSLSDFQQHHPLTRYGHYRTDIERMMRGEHNVVTERDPVIFAVTSGTSGTASILPMQSKQRKIFFMEGVSLAYHCMAHTFPGSKFLRKDFKVQRLEFSSFLSFMGWAGWQWLKVEMERAGRGITHKLLCQYIADGEYSYSL